MKKGKLIVGLDVGTTKVCALVGEVNPIRRSGGSLLSNRVKEDGVEIIGIGNAPARGLRKGAIVNIEDTARSIKSALQEAQAMAGIDIKAVYAGIAEAHINSLSSNGVIATRGKEITQKDIERVIEAARAVAIPLDREVLHVIPSGFIVDGQNGINDPRGMAGVRLEAKVRIVTATLTSVQNLIKSCKRAGIQVIDIVLGPLASTEAVLTEDEREIGVGIVDIGGGTTEIALFYEGNLCHVSVLTVGGNNFTNDVAIGLRTHLPEAERIKKTYGCALLGMVQPDEEIEITYAGDKPPRRLPRRHLIEIIQPRAEELFSLIGEEIKKSGYYNLLASGVVLTGGVATMRGIDVMAENILGLPVRIGVPKYIGGTQIVCNPEYATGVGLILHGAKESIAERSFNGGSLFSSAINKIRLFLKMSG